MNLQLLRNATQILSANGKTILIDPMLAPKGSYDPFQNTRNNLRNPLVDLPITEDELHTLIAKTDVVLLTHLHLDHWDATARELLPKDITLFCQPANTEAIREAGFTNVIPVHDELVWDDIRISRTGGHHGTGEIGERMGIVSGYVIAYGNDSIYITGDTIWCTEVQDALDKYHPAHVVLNGGAARFITGDPIVMDINDIITVCNYAPKANVHVVHLETANHGTESRADIKAALLAHNLTERCHVPNDGEWFI
ncbi:L-ascorbate metabolism protein UlaG, beta-lactamase superfamily [Mucilaginibacter lappiensis]|uniref:L-ascorbate metabolism protein UlaG (Beta-lactamase superfamily) n=1 Tax=Mucilaginibacter lappiensis TaxID=354630 RepID=A0ABR6PP82_9SPHI|nr:MBL fold metallo-hydrolase [Mucilaginibacter lappiensis]MBB6111582.1 L-ascorbate metabolism protein UlaG (beta-lactamase superfamily) [Mucilaginibacter lappiensis]SIR85124.1 L-ascorbate metabolism protein UlaG, beta-lactamase superfamily [Mucilaginibacter lappiensis]